MRTPQTQELQERMARIHLTQYSKCFRMLFLSIPSRKRDLILYESYVQTN